MNARSWARMRRSAWLVIVAIGAVGAAAQASDTGGTTTERLPVSAYVAPPEFANASLSANGRYLAALAPIRGKRNLVVIDLQTSTPRTISSFADFDVIRYHWVGSEFLVFTLGNLDTPTGAEFNRGGGLFAVRVDGSGVRKISATLAEQRASGAMVYRRLAFIASVPGSESEILAGGNLDTLRQDIYRVDLRTGMRSLLTAKHPGLVERWLLDNEGVPRVAVVVNEDDLPDTEKIRTVMLRDSIDAPWRELARFAYTDSGKWQPRSFAPDNRNLIVQSAAGRDTSALFIFDIEQKRLGDMLAGHPRYDASEAALLGDPVTRRVIGLSLRDERQQTVHFDDDHARLQSGMEAHFKDKAVQLQRAGNGKTLVTVWSDRDPHRYYLYDEGKRSLAPLLRSRKDVDERHLVEMRPFLLKTRDGLEIPSYYFLPASHKPGQRLPVVVHIHGGPHSRADHWGPMHTFGTREAQLLASRGYAVVLPNFRITPGLGRKVYEAGFGEIGRKMSQDHEDAARWAIDNGFADPQRICISGASYGGYASLWASIRSADVFRCAIAGLVVSDLKLEITSTQTDFHASTGGVAFWKRLIGMKGDDWEPALANSPAQHAERSSIPLFIYAGGADTRTPLEQTHRFVDALKRAGKQPVKLIIKHDEGHGFGKLENNVELYEEMLKFLDQQIGAGSRDASGTPRTPPQ